ncbi:hypothetical protein M3G04_04645 [Dietzia cinnamea]|uniref:hypothetical protein n=1 Tax=Dietzia cinnamea TaxID=321318 RepID=UPI00223A8C4F|nr:hypothetical protein [Dietzia cinnamea]MCT2300192.1 hypothetical protein [Dietzia cinnamea]
MMATKQYAGYVADDQLDTNPDFARRQLDTYSTVLCMLRHFPHAETYSNTATSADCEQMAALITDRIGAGWGRANGMVVAKDPKGALHLFAGDIVGVTPQSVQFSNGTIIPCGRIIAVGLQ